MEKQSKIKRITQFFVLVLFVLFSSQALAQQSTIKGLVKDETGVPIIGANVSVKGKRLRREEYEKHQHKKLCDSFNF